MNARTSVVLALVAGSGVALAIKTCDGEHTDRTVANGPAPTSIPEPIARNAEEAFGADTPPEPARSVAPAERAQANGGRESVTAPVLPGIALAGTQGLADAPPPLLMPTIEGFEAEGEDLSWSVAAEGRILGKLSRITNLALASVQVDCRTTICRIHLTQPRSDPSALRQLVSDYDEATWAFSSEGNELAYLKRSEIDVQGRQ